MSRQLQRNYFKVGPLGVVISSVALSSAIAIAQDSPVRPADSKARNETTANDIPVVTAPTWPGATQLYLAPQVVDAFVTNGAHIPLHLAGTIDFLGPFSIQNSTEEDDHTRVRSASLEVYGSVNPLMNLHVDITNETIGAKTNTVMREGFVEFPRIGDKSRLRLGSFFLNVGRLNSVRQADWMFVSAPEVQRKFFGNPATNDSGVEFTDSFGEKQGARAPLEVTLGVTNGYTYGYSHESGSKPLTPTHYLHPTYFKALGERRRALYGLTYLSRKAADGTTTRISGFDVSYKNGLGPNFSQFWQSEIYHRFQQVSSIPLEEDIGGYVYGQRAIATGYSLGLRLDLYTVRSLTEADGSQRRNLNYALDPVLTYYLDPTTRVRTAYTIAVDTRGDNSDRVEQRIEFQLIATLGERLADDW